MKVRIYMAKVCVEGIFDGVINYRVIKYLSVLVTNKLPSGSVFSQFFTSMTHTKMKNFVDLTYCLGVINYKITGLLHN